ncbi:MAG: hypothetical protein ABIU05_10430, partial [Nitrospirales bacterium]
EDGCGLTRCPRNRGKVRVRKMNLLELMQHEEIRLWNATLGPKLIQDLLTGNTSSIERNLPWTEAGQLPVCRVPHPLPLS